MNWITIDDKYINLDNIAFLSKGDSVQAFDEQDPRQCKINFIGGAFILLESVTYEYTRKFIEDYLQKLQELRTK